MAVARRWCGTRTGWATILAFPAVLLTLGHGQNALLSAALIARAPCGWTGGPCWRASPSACSPTKPQLGLALPFALLFARRWTTIGSAAFTVLAFAGASLAAFGPDAWRGFLAGAPLARATLERGLVDPAKLTSAFAAVRVLGGPPLPWRTACRRRSRSP